MWTLGLAEQALAESAWVAPTGSGVVYGGVGVTTFATGASPLPRDRQIRSRLDGYAAFGLGRGIQLSVDVPLVYNTVLPIANRGPCPGVDDWCAPVASAGEAGAQLRIGAEAGPVRITPAVGLRGDPWNAATRDRWTNAGLGTTSLVGGLVVEPTFPGGGVVLWAHYARILTRPGVWPADLATGGVAVHGSLDRWTGEAEVSALGRLGGVAYGDPWLERWYDDPDRWGALAYRELKARLKASFAWSERSGLHLSVGRVLLAANGPGDATDVSVGVHHSWSRARPDGDEPLLSPRRPSPGTDEPGSGGP